MAKGAAPEKMTEAERGKLAKEALAEIAALKVRNTAALRSLVPWDAKAVGAFLEEHDTELAPRVKREVRNKLKTGLKNPRHRE